MVDGEQRRRGASAPTRWLRCGGATRRRWPCAHGGREAYSGTRALRKYTFGVLRYPTSTLMEGYPTYPSISVDRCTGLPMTHFWGSQSLSV
eukprot:6177425-Pleurochrysis_carterae.AAC.4